jgi:hypothetical protein
MDLLDPGTFPGALLGVQLALVAAGGLVAMLTLWLGGLLFQVENASFFDSLGALILTGIVSALVHAFAGLPPRQELAVWLGIFLLTIKLVYETGFGKALLCWGLVLGLEAGAGAYLWNHSATFQALLQGKPVPGATTTSPEDQPPAPAPGASPESDTRQAGNTEGESPTSVASPSPSEVETPAVESPEVESPMEESPRGEGTTHEGDSEPQSEPSKTPGTETPSEEPVSVLPPETIPKNPPETPSEGVSPSSDPSLQESPENASEEAYRGPDSEPPPATPTRPRDLWGKDLLGKTMPSLLAVDGYGDAMDVSKKGGGLPMWLSFATSSSDGFEKHANLISNLGVFLDEKIRFMTLMDFGTLRGEDLIEAVIGISMRFGLEGTQVFGLRSRDWPRGVPGEGELYHLLVGAKGRVRKILRGPIPEAKIRWYVDRLTRK